MTQDSPSRRQDQFVLRLPDGMRDRLKDAAENSNRSMNAEIVARLQVTLDADEQIGPGSGLTKEEVDRIANFAAAKAAVEAIDGILGMLALPDGTPDAERFQQMFKKNALLGEQKRKDPGGDELT